MNYYEVLGVNVTASDSEIRRAYLKLSLQWHPDKRRGESSNEDVFHYIQEAYETLSCPEKRCLYDFVGAFAMLADAPAAYSVRPSPPPAEAASRSATAPHISSLWSGSSGDFAHPWGPSSSSSAARSSPCPSSDTCISSSPGATAGGAFMQHVSSFMRPGSHVIDEMNWSDSNCHGGATPDRSTTLPVATAPSAAGPATAGAPSSCPLHSQLPAQHATGGLHLPTEPSHGPYSPNGSSVLGKRLRNAVATDGDMQGLQPGPVPGVQPAESPQPPLPPQSSGGNGVAVLAVGQPAASADVHHQLLLTLEEMYSGCIKQLRLQRRVFRRPQHPLHSSGIGIGGGVAATHGGNGDSAADPMVVNVEELFRVEVQPGWREGTKVTFPGKGDELPGGSAGDMVLVVAQAAHGRYERRGNDLHTVVEVPLVDALTGGYTAITTLDGRTLMLHLGPACLQPFSERVVKGEGMPIPPGRGARGRTAAAGGFAAAAASAAASLPLGWGRGDLHVRFRVAFPAELSPQQKEQLRLALLEQAAPAAGSS